MIKGFLLMFDHIVWFSLRLVRWIAWLIIESFVMGINIFFCIGLLLLFPVLSFM